MDHGTVLSHDRIVPCAPLGCIFLDRLPSINKWWSAAVSAAAMTVSEYEKERLRRIRENEEALKLIFGTKARSPDILPLTHYQ